jgi:hypothetical protein
MNKTSTPKKITEPVNEKMNEAIDNKKEFPFEPGNNVINTILNYSKALSIRKSTSLKHIEIVLN